MSRKTVRKSVFDNNLVDSFDFDCPGSSSTPMKQGAKNVVKSQITSRSKSQTETDKVSDEESEELFDITCDSDENGEVNTASFLRSTFQNSVTLFFGDKINEENVWNIELIDNMYKLVLKKDEYVNNFHVLGSALAASAKIYGMRVDSLHGDMMRLVTDMHLGKIIENRVVEDTTRNITDDSVPKAENKERKKKNRGLFLVNDDVINGDIKTFECIDPIFQIRATTLGDTTSLSNLFIRTLPLSYPNKLELGLNDLLYNISENNFDEEKEYSDTKCKIFVADYTTQLCSFCDATNFRMLDLTPSKVHITSECGKSNVNLNLTQQDVHFYEHGNIEQPDLEVDEESNFQDLERSANLDNNGDFTCSDGTDTICVKRGQSANQLPEFIRNMNRVTLRLWAGPDHLKKIIPAIENVEHVAAPRVRTKRRVKAVLERVRDMDDLYTTRQRIKVKARRLDKWINGKQNDKFPENYCIEIKQCEFDFEDGKNDPVVLPEDYYNTAMINDAGNNHSRLDADYCPMNQDESNRNYCDENVVATVPVVDIEEPDLLKLHNIKYFRRPKIIDMRRMKRSIYGILTNNRKLGKNSMMFSELAKKLYKIVGSKQAQQLTVPFVMLALLFVTNEKKLELSQEDENDFKITLSNRIILNRNCIMKPFKAI